MKRCSTPKTASTTWPRRRTPARTTEACGRPHHGIYDGDGHVYQYDCFLPDLLPKVMVVSLECFAAGDPVQVFDEGTFYSPDEIIGRARSRLGETRYGLVCNNCENFATWCRLGGAVEEKPEEADTLIPINP